MSLEVLRLREVIVAATANAAEISPAEITDDMNLFTLGLDSLNLAGILIDIEEAIGAEVPPELLDRFLDVGDTVTVADIVRVMGAWDPDTTVPDNPYGPVVVVRGK